MPHKASWYATDGGGYLANRKWVKDKFRKADDEKHEWIPSDMIEEMVDRDVSAEDAGTTAEWIAAQHQMRSPTEAILFWPDTNMEVMELWEDALDAGTNDGVAFIQEKEISTVTFDLQGHSGALYVKEGDKKVPQTKGQGEFHDHLRRLVRASDTPQDYRTQLKKFLKDEKGIWNGNIDFLPEEWDKPEHEAIETTHEGKNNKPLGGNLYLLGKSVEKAFEAVLAVVSP